VRERRVPKEVRTKMKESPKEGSQRRNARKVTVDMTVKGFQW
jgi:hypothetical protein